MCDRKRLPGTRQRFGYLSGEFLALLNGLDLYTHSFLRSHILMILLVAAFTIYFYIMNRQQGRGLKTIEGVVSLKKVRNARSLANQSE